MMVCTCVALVLYPSQNRVCAAHQALVATPLHAGILGQRSCLLTHLQTWRMLYMCCILLCPCTQSQRYVIEIQRTLSRERCLAPLEVRSRVHSAGMASYSLLITDADAEASTCLRRCRHDGCDSVDVPYDQPIVHAWRRGAPQPGMEVDMLQRVLEVCCVALQ